MIGKIAVIRVCGADAAMSCGDVVAKHLADLHENGIVAVPRHARTGAVSRGYALLAF